MSVQKTSKKYFEQAPVDEKVEECSSSPPSSGRKGVSRAWIFLSLFLLVLSVILIAYVIYLNQTRTEETIIVQHKVSTKKEVLIVYADYFKTPEEQKTYENEFKTAMDNIPVPSVISDVPRIDFLRVCNLTVPITNNRSLEDFRNQFQEMIAGQRLQRRSVTDIFYIEPSVYHGCCVSRRKFISPNSAKEANSKQKLSLVQYAGAERQYFLSQSCEHDSRCPLQCGCRQQSGIYKALVHNPEFGQGASANTLPPFVVRSIQIPGSCKCINGAEATATPRIKLHTKTKTT